MAEARAAARDRPEREVPEVDWASIWMAGDGAPSDEAAIGRIVRTASEVARKIARGSGAASPRPAPGDGVAGIAPREAPARTARPMVGDPPTGSEPVTAEPEPVIAVGSVAALVEPARTGAEAATVGTEPLTPWIEPHVAQPAPEEPATPPAGTKVAGVARRARRATKRVTVSHAAWVTVFTWIRNIGAIMLLFVAWQLWGTAISQHEAQSRLQSEFEASVRAHHADKGSATSLIPATTFVHSGGDGSVLAELQIPKIGVNQYVVEGTSEADLSKGPGHYSGTAMPGQAGNVAIAGHRTTHGAPFNRLGQLAPGDRIIVTTTFGQSWTYIVSAAPVAVSPRDVAVLNYFGDNRITLTTCTPEFSATQRLIVVGALQQAAGAPKEAGHVSYHVVNPGTASWDWSLLPVVGIEASLLVLLGLTYRRFRVWLGSIGMWLVLVPLWAAGLYLLFTTLTTFLPSTF